MSGQRFDVGIIGGGVIGLSCAWRLAQAGARVALFERGEIGREASWAAAGMLAAQCEAAHHPPSESGSIEYSMRAAMFDLCLQSRAMYADFADELLDVTGVDIELSLKGHQRNDWRTPGILYVQTRDDDMAFADFAQQKEQGYEAERVLDFNGSPAVWLNEEGQVNNRVLVKALRAAALRSGVTFYTNREPHLWTEAVRGIRFSSDDQSPRYRIRGAQAGIDLAEFKHTLHCSGAWNEYVRPIAGQIVAVRGHKKVERVIYASDVYLVPRRNGRLLIGATSEDVGFRKHVTPRGLKNLLNAACRVVPELEDCPIIDQWAGLRPASLDGLPVLGRTPLHNSYAATGHYRNGILLAPITAKLMTDCILNDVEPPREFSIQRFQNEEVVA